MALSKIQNIGSQVVPNLGRRNILINGGMKIWQRGTSQDSITSPNYMCDRWRGVHAGLDGNFDWDQVSTSTPEGFPYALKISTDAVESSLDAGDNIKFQQKLEGQQLQHLLKGTTNAKKTTISFWVKSSVASTYTFELVDNDNSRTLSKSYTINSANTWEHKILTLDGDTSGTLDNDNANSMTLNWYIDSGSDLTSGTFNDTAWKSTVETERVYDTTGWLVASSREFYITGVQWEVGDTATDFEHLSFGEELRLCQRYFITTDPDKLGDAGGQSCYIMGSGYNARARYTYYYPTTMRTDPAGTLVDSAGNGNVAVWHGATRIDYTGSWTFQNTMTCASYYTDTTPGSTLNGKGVMSYMGDESSNYNYYLEIDAEF